MSAQQNDRPLRRPRQPEGVRPAASIASVATTGTPGGGAMELRDYVAVIGRRRQLIMLTPIIAALAAALAATLMPPRYSTYTTLHVATPASLSTANVLGSTDYMDRLQNTYAQLAASAEIRDVVKQRLRLSSRPKISVALHPNTELMDVKAEASRASVAAAAANLDAKLLIERARKLGTDLLKETDAQFNQQMSGLQKQIATERAQYSALVARGTNTAAEQAKAADLRTDIEVKVTAATQQQAAYETNRASIVDRSNLLSVVAPATVPSAASGPSVKLAVVVGLFLGLIVGLGLAFLYENLSTRMEATDEIEEAAGLPVLGAIPSAEAKEGPLFNSGSPTEEAFRRLRTNILALERSGSANVLLVTSAEPNEGKSTVVANLAASLAQTGQRVVAVDADLRLPTLHDILGVSNKEGLGNVIKGDARLETALQKVPRVPGMHLLPSGGPFDHPAELLASPRAGKVIQELAKRYDVVLVDSPALLALADALSLATEIQDVMIVVGRTQTRREALISVKKQLSAVGAQPLGVIVNRAEATPSYHYYTYKRS
jgi:non-specific protein-tyrosine kinase